MSTFTDLTYTRALGMKDVTVSPEVHLREQPLVRRCTTKPVGLLKFSSSLSDFGH